VLTCERTVNRKIKALSTLLKEKTKMENEENIEIEVNKKTKPENIPEKFWDAEKGEIRIDDLVKSYAHLEKKINSMIKVPTKDASEEEFSMFYKNMGVPETANDYQIEQRHELLVSDAEINERLRKAGFTSQQAQLVYDLAAERVIPMLESLAAEYETENHRRKLEEHFGGKERWDEVSRQLRAWADANISEDELDALGSSYEGIMALHNMMKSSEPSISKNDMIGAGGAITEESLREMMQDPRYWRDKDSSYINRISSGFKKLYPE
jgi:hypothetical protein